MAVGAWRHPWPRIMRNTAIELDRAGRAVSRVPYVHSSARPGRSSSIVELRMLRAASRHASARPAPRSGHRLLSGRRPRSLRCPPFPSPGSARSPPATLAQVPAFPSLGAALGARRPRSLRCPPFPSLGAALGARRPRSLRCPPFPSLGASLGARRPRSLRCPPFPSLGASLGARRPGSLRCPPFRNARRPA